MLLLGKFLSTCLVNVLYLTLFNLDLYKISLLPVDNVCQPFFTTENALIVTLAHAHCIA